MSSVLYVVCSHEHAVSSKWSTRLHPAPCTCHVLSPRHVLLTPYQVGQLASTLGWGLVVEAIGLRADYVLKTELREFQAEFAQRLPDSNEGGIGNVAPPTIRVRINAKLIKMPRRSIVASKNFEYLIDAKENSMAEIIGAFDTALGKTMRRMVEWTLNIGEKNDDPRDKTARQRQ